MRTSRTDDMLLIWRSLLVAGLLTGGVLTAAAEKGPGTFFNPSDGNAVSSVTNAQASVRRTIAFLGGSITEMNGFRPRVMKALREKYPDVAFTEFAAGLSSTCSDTGAFRLRRDLLSQCVPDLLIVDEAVNDDQDGHFARLHAIRGVEGIVRQTLLANPACKVVLALMVNETQYAELMQGKEPLQYAVEKEVAKHYGLAVADVGSALAASAKAGGMSWTEYKDCHPSPVGCDLVAKVVMEAVAKAFDPRATPAPQTLPAPMDEHAYFHAYEVPLKSVSGGDAWKVSKLDWSAIVGEKRDYFARGDILWCETTNAVASVAFTGRAVGFTLTAGPDAGDLEVSVDGGAFERICLRANYGRLHYPYTVMVANDLKDGAHSVRFRVVAAQRGKRIGTIVRINRIYANGARTLTEKISASCKVTGTDRFYGFERTTFEFQGHEAWVVEPSVGTAEGCPWTWTMQWATAFVDRTPALHLLKEGWHHVTIDTYRHRMDDEGIAVSAAFQKYLVDELGFAPKACLIGMSWGGFFSTRYTAAHPENVRAIYYDCPLLNFDKFRDFPPEKICGEIGVWANAVPVGGWSDDPRMPVNMAGTIAAAKIPVYLIYGGADRVVPPETNCELFVPRFKEAGGSITVSRRGAYGHHPHGLEQNDTRLAAFFCEATYGQKPVFGKKTARPRPSAALCERLNSDADVIGIVHWGLNTYTDREWGFGDEDPSKLDPKTFDADQIVGACAAGGLKGLVVVAKHHDGFCLWPTKTTDHNISKSPFRSGKGDYVKEMERACRKAGIRFGVYVSPWDRNNAHYGTEKYVSLYHEQIKELLSGDYGEVFEMWFDGANGGDGWYGGANEKRIIPNGYYRFDEVFAFVRKLQPKVCIFAGENDASDFRWPGNEQGKLDPNSRATIDTVGGFADGEYGNPAYAYQINMGTPKGRFFRVCEADFPLRKGWFYHAKDDGRSKHAAYLMQRYLDTVGNGGTMNLGVSPTRDGVLPDEDVKALAGFKTLKDAFFAHEVTADGQPFNVIVLSEDISVGEQVDHWTVFGDKRPDGLRDWIAGGRAIGRRRIRLVGRTVAPKKLDLDVSATGPNPGRVTMRRYLVDAELLNLIRGATTDSGETDTAKWMTGAR